VTDGAHPPPRKNPVIRLNRRMLVVLRREAALRDMSIDHLVATLLDTIVADGLTRAVLDDHPPPPRRRPGRPRKNLPDGHLRKCAQKSSVPGCMSEQIAKYSDTHARPEGVSPRGERGRRARSQRENPLWPR
jgi:hypothetical protein